MGHKQKRMMRDEAWAAAAQANPAAAEIVAYAYLGCFIYVVITVVITAVCLVCGMLAVIQFPGLLD